MRIREKMRQSIADRAFLLHEAYPNLISGILYGTPNLSGVIAKGRAKSKLWAPPAVPPHKRQREYQGSLTHSHPLERNEKYGQVPGCVVKSHIPRKWHYSLLLSLLVETHHSLQWPEFLSFRLPSLAFLYLLWVLTWLQDTQMCWCKSPLLCPMIWAWICFCSQEPWFAPTTALGAEQINADTLRFFSDWRLDSKALMDMSSSSLTQQYLALSDPGTSTSLPGYLLHWHPCSLSTVHALTEKLIDMSICQQLIISISWDHELFSPLWGRPCSDIYPPALCWQLAVGKRFHIISLK